VSSPAELANLLKAEAERQLSVDCQRSLEIAEEICRLEPDGSVRALGLMARADALRELGRYVEATEAYQASAEVYRHVGDQVGWARTRIGALVTARYTGTQVQVLADLDEARRILGDHSLWLRLARLESHSGLLLAALGRGADALSAHRRALAAAEQLVPRNELVEAELLGNLSVAYYQVDEYARAQAFLERAVAIFERDGQREHLARAHRNFARFAAGRGHYSKALAAVLPGRRALLNLGRIDGAAHLGQVGVDCLVRLNRSVEAAELAAEVIGEFESTGARVEAAATHELRSLALARLGESHAALAELDRAEALVGSSDWESGLANVRLGRAVVLGETGQWALACAEATAVRDELRGRGLITRAVQADLVRARALRALGQPDAAAEAARSALDLVRERALPWLSYHAWRLLGELARDAGDADAALDAFLEGITSLEHVQGRILTEYRASFLADKVDLYEAAVDLLHIRGDVERAFELVERAKSRALVDALAGGLDIRVRPRTVEQRRLVDELAQLRREHDAMVEDADTNPELPPLERRISSMLEELRLAGADALEQLSLLETRVYSPQQQLEVATAVLEYYSVGTDLLVFVMDREQLRARRIPGALDQVVRLQRALRLNLEAAAAAPPQQRAALEPNARVLLQRLYDVVLAPIAEWSRNYERLVFLPHGTLHQLPFAALHDGHGYLVERFEVATAPSASSLSFCLRPRVRKSSRALVVANSADGALPGTLAEAHTVADLFPGECLLEEQVTLPNLRQRVRQADIIHLATHGVARLDMPLFSYLRLADGHLTALDCFELELDCALVTLSACESGGGVVAAGDEQIGLPRAFLYAGARSVLHTLWRVDDRATQVLMQRFYTDLRAGRGRGASLRNAQLAGLRSPDAHPVLWAGLVLVGDWR
jgi:CHAT domain-containing protein